ncbi:MAG: YedE-related selenium metabolism membrane protein [Planctomycetia bacterium]|nr:YedE-related selenium metabolism membrane protein [Planctomycetia bacterium]
MPDEPLLRGGGSPRRTWIGILCVALVGAGAAALVAAGNPGNMGVCGACFLRDLGGALGLITPGPKGRPAVVRPELVGLVLGALGLAVARGRFTARSGSHAASRFVLGMWMGLGALVFLGCPFRMLQRLGGGDLNALVGLAGFVPGVLLGLAFERKGYAIGRTQPAPAAVGLQGPLLLLLLLVVAEAGWLAAAPRPTSGGPPPRAPAALALGVGLLAGALLSASGFCAVNAARQVVTRPRGMLWAALALVAAYAAVSAATGRFSAGFAGQPVAHQDALWNALPMALVGLAGALGGGCPVRQVVMTGEGNGDAFVATCGILVGGVVAHGVGAVSTADGSTAPGRVLVAIGLVWTIGYGFLAARAARRAAAPTP